MTDTVVRRGYITLHRNPGGRFPLASLSSKRMWMVLCRESPSGRPRIEMYRSEESVGGQQPVRMVDLETVRSVQPVERKKSFLIELPEETMMLQCTSKADMEDWVRDTNRLRGGRVDLASGQNIGGHPPGQDIYEDVPDDETFRVVLRPTSSLGFSGSCYLEIQRDLNRNLFHITMMTKDEPSRPIVKWQIDHIRQYGSNHSAFKFQSGGKSPTGVGWFIVETESGAAQRIHKAVDYWAKYIVEQIRSAKMATSQRSAAHQTHSVPAPPPQSPSRHPPPPSLSSSMGGGSSAYAPLSVSTMDTPPVYQKVSASVSPGRHKPHSGTTSRQTNGSAGVYQPLGVKDASSTYASVNASSHQAGGGLAGGGPTPPTREATYMGLRAETRQPDNRETYAVPERK